MKKQTFKKFPQFITLKEITDNDPKMIALQLKQFLKDGGSPALFIQAVYFLRTWEMWENNYFLSPQDYQQELEKIYSDGDWSHYHLKMLNDMGFFIDKIKFVFFKKTYPTLNRQAGLSRLFSGVGTAVFMADYAKVTATAKLATVVGELSHAKDQLLESGKRAALLHELKAKLQVPKGRRLLH